MLHRKVKAFTMMELVVSITISSLVIFSAMDFFSSYKSLISRRSNSLDESGAILQFFDVIARDVTNCDKITGDTSLLLINTGDKFIRYEIDDSSMIRYASESGDTFCFNSLSLGLRKDIVTGYIETLSFKVATKNEFYPFIIKKVYSNCQIINALVFSKKEYAD